jgi:serine/threonine protein kinase
VRRPTISVADAASLAQDVLPVPNLVHFSGNELGVVRVFEWIDGQHPTSLTGQPGKVRRFAAELATALAALHAIDMRGFSSRLDGSAPSFPRWRDYVDYRLGQIRERSAAKDALDESTLDRACEAIARLAAEVDDSVVPSLCHRDLHPNNLLVNAEGDLVAVLDWDMAEVWDAAGEWFKLEVMLFPVVPGMEEPGGEDAACPSTSMARIIVERMTAHGRSADVRHLDFPECGHVVVRPWALGQAPPTPFDNAGTADALDAAHDVALPAVVHHLSGDS